MPSTLTERTIASMRQAQGQGIVIPLLFDMLKTPVDIKDDEDVEFLHDLTMKGLKRDEEREYRPMFSPSMLASCMRKVYLTKHWKELGFERVILPNPEAHMIFAEGDWLHLKWQFLLWKLSRANSRFKLIDCEVRVESKRGDHGGTLDVICTLDDVPYILDVKGLNFRGWSKAIKDEMSDDYRVQLPDYIMLYNTSRQPHVKAIRNKIGKIETGILLVQHKGGPDKDHPLALHEIHLSYQENLPLVQKRLEDLRDYEARKEIPQAECVSTRQYQFLGCKFADYCKVEVKRKQREQAEMDVSDAKKFTLRKTRKRRSNRS